jgi:hypothetical protein
MPVRDTHLAHARDRIILNLWQRLARWLVDGARNVMVTATPAACKGRARHSLDRGVRREYKGINDACSRTHRRPARSKMPMEWTVEQKGEYRARFTPSEDGVYRISVDGRTKTGLDTGRGTSSLRVGPSDAEYFDAAMRAPLLQRVAEETEGRFFRAADVSSLVDAITYSGRGVTVVEERDLWDMPIVLFLLLARGSGYRPDKDWRDEAGEGRRGAGAPAPPRSPSAAGLSATGPATCQTCRMTAVRVHPDGVLASAAAVRGRMTTRRRGELSEDPHERDHIPTHSKLRASCRSTIRRCSSFR